MEMVLDRLLPSMPACPLPRKPTVAKSPPKLPNVEGRKIPARKLSGLVPMTVAAPPPAGMYWMLLGTSGDAPLVVGSTTKYPPPNEPNPAGACTIVSGKVPVGKLVKATGPATTRAEPKKTNER